MINRDLILQDYFQLTRIINKANKLKDAHTSIIFETEVSEDLCISLFAKSDEKKFLLVFKKPTRFWEVSMSNHFHHFSMFIIKILKENNTSNILVNAHELISTALHRLLNYQPEDL